MIESGPRPAPEAFAGSPLEASIDEVASPPPSPLPPGVLCVRPGPGANCSSAGSAIDVLFYGSAIVGALAVALAAALTPREPEPRSDDENEAE